MPVSRYGVEFYGSMGNMAQFLQSLRGMYSQTANMHKSAAMSPVTSNIRMPSISMGNVTTQIDSYNRTLTQSGQVFHRYVAGYAADIKKLEVSSRSLGIGGVAFGGSAGRFSTFGTSVNPATGQAGVYAKDLRPVTQQFATGKYRETMGDLDKIIPAQKALIPLERQLLKISELRTLSAQAYGAQLATAGARAKELDTQFFKTKTKLDALTTGVMGTTYTGRTGRVYPWLQVQQKELDVLEKLRDPRTNLPIFGDTRTGLSAADDYERRLLINQSTRPDAKVQRALALSRGIPALEAELTSIQAQASLLESMITTTKQADARATRAFNRQEKALIRRNQGKLARLEAALNSTPPIARDLDFFLANSRDFRRQFQKQLGIDVPYVTAPSDSLRARNPRLAAQQDLQRESYSKALLARGITPESIKVNYDFERGLYRIEGAVAGLNNTQGTWGTSLDKNFQSVERLGGSLRGTGGFLRQTARDFQKVLEWTIATSVVFGSLGLVIGSISKISQVNADLQRFTITARTSGEETKQAFRDIADIAFRTATPLQELTAVMDDIALATRRVSQTSAEWKVAINSLAEAVGIFTNLTGRTTTEATDLLSAAYKQLQIAPAQLIPLLNKVTAVAGGNAQAITDIVSALGSVSEAAKAAGFTVDEQISSVQVLSQVTNKSAAEIATSFKNLFGSISSVGSEKALDEFGIKIRTETGELRKFLDIYKDIYDAREAGRISDGQLQDVIRGIAGGPRRAPDAAALLSNLPLIFEQLDKAANASNEALLANARVLDTNAAKLQQIRTQFDAALVEQFTDAVNKLIEVLYTLGSALSGFIGGAEGGAFGSMIVQLALMSIGVGGLVKGFGILQRVVRNLRVDMRGLGAANKAVTDGPWSRLFGKYENPQLVRPGNLPKVPGWRIVGTGDNQRYIPLSGATARFAQPFPPNLTVVPPRANPLERLGANARFGLQNLIGTPNGRIGLGIGGGVAGALALGGIGAATGNLQALTSAGQGLGLTLALLGGPAGIAAGVTLATVSTALQLFNDQQIRSAERAKELRFSILDNIKSLEEQRRAVDNAKAAQAEQAKTIQELSSLQSLSADETDRLNTAQQNYVENAFEISAANRQIVETTKELLTQIPQLSKEYGSLIKAAEGGRIYSPGVLTPLAEKLAGDILGITNPGATGLRFNTGPVNESAIVGRPRVGSVTSFPAPISADELFDKLLGGGLDVTRGYLLGQNGQAEIDSRILELVDIQLRSASEEYKTTEEYREIVNRFGNWVDALNDPSFTLGANVNAAGAIVQAQSALGILRGEAATNASARSSIANDLFSRLGSLQDLQTIWAQDQRNRPLAENATISTPLTRREAETNIEQFLFGSNGRGGFLAGTKGLNTGDISVNEAKELFALITSMDPALYGLAKNTEMFNAAVYKYFADNGIILDELKIDAENLGVIFGELRDAITEDVDQGKASLYNELLGLRARKMGGEYAENPQDYTREEAQLRALIAAYDDLGAAFKENAGVLEVFKEQISDIPQLQGIQYSSTESLISGLLNYAKTLGLTGDQIAVFSQQIRDMIAGLQTLDGIRAKYSISGTFDNAQLRNYLVGLRTALLATYQAGIATGRPSTVLLSSITQLDSAIGLVDRQTSLQRNINTTLSGGSGTKFPSTGSTSKGSTAYNKPGLLDIPEEFNEQTNRSVSSLLSEAVNTARRLQSQIPGETAANKSEIVAILDGTRKLLQTRGIGEEYLRRAMEELADQIKKQNDLLAKADTIRRIRVGGGDFAAIANVPVNKVSGVSVGGSGGPINVTLNLNGTLLTPAQFQQFADQVGAAIKRQLGS